MVKLKLPNDSFLRNLRPLGQCYASRNPLERWVYRARLKACLKWIEPDDGCFSLDVGTGGGMLLTTLDDLGPAVGFDNKDLGQAKGTLDHEKTRNSHLVQADGCHLPFKDGLFDYVLCISVLDHIENIKFALDEIRRVLKPTGKLIVGIENETPFMPLFVIYARLVRGWKLPFKGQLTHAYSPDEVQEFLNGRFEILRVERVPSFFPSCLSAYSGILYQPRLP